MDQSLAGIRVLDLTTLWAGPYATRLLADLGAEIIKVEGLDRPDLSRKMNQYADGNPGEDPINRSGLFNDLNRDKRGIVIDLSESRGRDLLLRLVEISDVVAENFTPRVLPSLGLGYETLRSVNPSIILLSVSGFGSTGPYRDFVALGSTIEQVSGLSSITGYSDQGPHRCGISYGDPVGALYGALTMIAALRRRVETGEGAHVEIALSEALTSLIPEYVLDSLWNQRDLGRRGNDDLFAIPSGCFPCAGVDEWVAIGVQTEKQWQGICSVVSPVWLDDERFRGVLDRWKNREALHHELVAWSRLYQAAHVVASLQAVGVPAEPVANMADVFCDPQLLARDFFTSIDHPSVGLRRYRGTPWQWESKRQAEHRGAPRFGGDTAGILRGLLGVTEEEIELLVRDRVIETLEANRDGHKKP